MSEKKVSRRQYLKYIGAGAVAVAAGAGFYYFAQSGQTTTPVTPSTISAVTSGTTGAKVLYGGTMADAGYSEPRTHCPNFVLSEPVENQTFVYDKLISYDWQGNLIPVLASSWDLSPDGTVCTLHLRDNVKFHDGVKMTSADVKWTIEAMVKYKSFVANNFSTVSRIDTPDDNTVTFNLSKPNRLFPWILADNYAPTCVLPKHLFEKYDDPTDPNKNPYINKPIGTGPFKFVEWVVGDHINYVVNNDYFKGRPYLDAIFFKKVSTPEAMLNGVEAGEVSFMNRPPSTYADLNRLLNSPKVGVGKVKAYRMEWLGFNLLRKPYDDKRVRTAIAYAIDRDEINSRVFLNMCSPNYGGFLQVTAWCYNSTDQFPHFDAKMAEKILDDAGYPRKSDGVRFDGGTIYSPQDLGFPETLQVLKEQLKRVGVEVNISPIEFGAYTEKVVNKRDFDLALGGGGLGPSPQSFTIMVLPTGLRNIMGYNNPDIPALYEKMYAAKSDEEVATYFRQVQKYLVDDLPRLSIVDYTDAYIYRPEFHAWFWEPEALKKVAWMDFTRTWRDGGRPTP